MEVTCNAQVVEQKWAARHDKEGQTVHDMLLDLSGLYVKSAQIMASKQDFMPEPWCRRLAAMFDSMPPKPWAHVARVCLVLSTSGCLFCRGLCASANICCMEDTYMACALVIGKCELAESMAVQLHSSRPPE